MRWFFSACLFLTLAASAVAQGVQVVRSRSDQFTVYGPQSSVRFGQAAVQSVSIGEGQFFWFSSDRRTNEVTRVRLVPGLVAVSCERIKEALLFELGEKDSSGKKIHIQLNDRITENDIKVLAGQYARGWVYSVELPTDIDANHFTTTIIEVLLTELANRRSTGEQFDVPAWLLAGFTAHLEAVRFESFALQPNMQLYREEEKVDPVTGKDGKLRVRFQEQAPLSFDEMSWPKNLTSEKAALFQDSAHLFVYELFRFEDGRHCLKRFLSELPSHKNWQFAFLAAFKPHFAQLIDVEKWWALQYSTLAGRDMTRLLSEEESWEKLKAALDISAQVHLKTDRLPVEAKITLQEVIQQWDINQQQVALSKAIGQLRKLRTRVQPELVSLVDDYRKTVEKYIEQRAPQDRKAKFNEPEVNTKLLSKSVCRQLDNLDEKRAQLRQTMMANAKPAFPQMPSPKPDVLKVKANR